MAKIPEESTPNLSRRQLLQRATICGGALLLGLNRQLVGLQRNPFLGGTFLGLVDFIGEASAPLDTPIGAELDERLYTDLSQVSASHRVTPTSRFYVRTGASQLLPEVQGWRLHIGGLVEHPITLDVDTLQRQARPIGLHLMECAGNNRLTRFGLLSVANWEGVPFSEIANRVKLKRGAVRVLVSGFDRYVMRSRTSIPGASWIFTLDQLLNAGAFLATKMNGASLTKNHGAPLRLVVPGWYGCACIKWVQQIAFVGNGARATSQMQEFSSRTLQDGIPQLASEYEPAAIDQTAMPVRVEKWRVDERIKYRVVGVLWGGSQIVKTLEIRFNPEEEFVVVDHFHQTTSDPWTLWSHDWMPVAPNVYEIRLKITDPQVRARKLDAGYYDRSVSITDV